MSKIAYTNKVNLITNPLIPAINKVQADDMNEIKASVNTLYDNVDLKAPLASPTFTGTVTLPSTTNLTTYSTSETIVGTWTDGKTIYKRAISGTTGAAAGDYVADISSWNVDKLISIKGHLTKGTLKLPIPFPNAVDATYLIFGYINGANFRMAYGSNVTSASFVVVLEYTKTA